MCIYIYIYIYISTLYNSQGYLWIRLLVIKNYHPKNLYINKKNTQIHKSVYCQVLCKAGFYAPTCFYYLLESSSGSHTVITTLSACHTSVNFNLICINIIQ